MPGMQGRSLKHFVYYLCLSLGAFKATIRTSSGPSASRIEDKIVSISVRVLEYC